MDSQGPVHRAYKEYITNNWKDSNNDWKDFRDRFQDGVDSPQWDGPMEKACEEVVKDSSKYSEQVYETIINEGPSNPDDWDDIVENAAHSCMLSIGAYSRGAINQL